MAYEDRGIDNDSSANIAPGSPMLPHEHPAHNLPNATEHHWGTEIAPEDWKEIKPTSDTGTEITRWNGRKVYSDRSKRSDEVQ